MTDNSIKGHRQLHTKVKTARGRKNSSTKWLQRQLNDPYVQLAKKDGYRSRAAYKLIGIDDKFKIIKNSKSIIDLGAAPGGWSQVCTKRCNDTKIIGIDLQDVEPIAGAKFIKADFTTDEGLKLLEDELGDNKVDLVLSDMAAASTGHQQTDHIKTIYLCELAFEFAKDHLRPGGNFAAKILQGGTESDLLNGMKKYFKTVRHFKPEASRKDSTEMFVVALDFKGN